MNYRAFCFGYFTCVCLTSLYQDMMGKELYLKKVNEYWMPTTPWIWVAIFIVGLVAFIYLEIKDILND